jgi:hypothetical protein
MPSDTVDTWLDDCSGGEWSSDRYWDYFDGAPSGEVFEGDKWWTGPVPSYLMLATAIIMKRQRPFQRLAHVRARRAPVPQIWRLSDSDGKKGKLAGKGPLRPSAARFLIALLHFVLGFFGSHKVDARNNP